MASSKLVDMRMTLVGGLGAVTSYECNESGEFCQEIFISYSSP